MTFEKARDLLKMIEVKEPNELIVNSWWGSFAKDYKEALQIAIKVLEQEPCEDCISREAVLEVLKKNRYCFNISQEGRWAGKVLWSENLIKDDACKEIEELPSVTSKEKIVHCKDCKYRDYWGKCNKWSKELDAHKTYILDENMFCGFAENKDGENKE